MTIRKATVLLDASDLPLLEYRQMWVAMGYAMVCIRGKKIAVHKLILGVPGSVRVSHLNGNKLDNRRVNLHILHTVPYVRISVTRGRKNGRTTRKVNSILGLPQYKGVQRRADLGRWRISLRVGQYKYSRYFQDSTAAALARNAFIVDAFQDMRGVT